MLLKGYTTCFSLPKIKFVMGVWGVGGFDFGDLCHLQGYFILHRVICHLSFGVDVRIKAKGHNVISIIEGMNLISVHFWTYLIYV